MANRNRPPVTSLIVLPARCVLAIALVVPGALLAQPARNTDDLRAAFQQMLENNRPALSIPGAKGISLNRPSEGSSYEEHQVLPVTSEVIDHLDAPPHARSRTIVPRPRKRPVAAPHVDVIIPFKIDSHELVGAAPQLLDQVAEILKQPGRETVRLAVNGHTDRATGTLAHNMELSQRRAASVIRYLTTTAGLSPDRFEGYGYGPNRPRHDESTPQGIENNRRVEFELLQGQ